MFITGIPRTVGIAVATGPDNIIGVDNAIPWECPEDLKWFQQLTTGSVVVMGRKTFQSLPNKFKPLPNRYNVVCTKNKPFRAPGIDDDLYRKTVLGSLVGSTRNPDTGEWTHEDPALFSRMVEQGVQVIHSLENVLALEPNLAPVWIVGGAEIYKQALDCVMCDVIFITQVCPTNPLDLEGKRVVRFPVLNTNNWNIVDLGPCGPNARRYMCSRR